MNEVLVVDNESSPSSRDALLDLQLEKVVVLPVVENRGYGAGVNVALRELRARENFPDYLLLVNNDLVAEDGAITALIAHMNGATSCGVVGPIIYDFPVGQTASVQSAGGRLHPWRGTVSQQTTSAANPTIDYVTFALALIRYEALECVGGLDESYFMYWEDVDACQRLRKAGWELAIEPRARAWHELSASSEQAGPLLLSYGTWAACTFASLHGMPWPITVRVRAALSAARRWMRGRPDEARALLRGLSMPRDPRRSAYESRHQSLTE